MRTSNDEASLIPVLDISNVDSQTGDALVDAVKKWGFVYVRGKEIGFTQENIDSMFQRVGSGPLFRKGIQTSHLSDCPNSPVISSIRPKKKRNSSLSPKKCVLSD